MLEVRVIVVMAKAPVPGRVKTRLAPLLGDEGAAALCRAMTADVVAAMVGTGLPVRIAADDPTDPWLRSLGVPVEAQGAGDLGDRLHHALRNGGIAVGTDAPTLPGSMVAEAARALEDADVVFAPAFDGGYVLVGVRPEALGVFDGIPWSSPDTLAASVERARTLGLRVELLGSWYDVDEPADLDFLRTQLRALGGTVAPETRSFLVG